jgi:DNA-binding winged helix-turn-helix (wHTH) protein/Tol biopolymer transport system component
VTEHKYHVFNFADVEVREREFSVIKAGEVLPVEPKAFRVLLFLLRNPHKLITKDQLLDAVWNDISVSENSLTRSIALLRRVLGDDTHEPRYIATVPTVGYRFLCDVQVTEDGFVRLDTGDPLPPPAIHTSIPAKPVELKSQQREASRKKATALVLAGLVAATLGVFVVASLIRREVSKHDVPGHAVSHLSTEQRITSNPPEVPVGGAIVSLDGKYVAYTDPTGLYLRQISTGETRPWGLPTGFVGWAQSWFPDSTHLLVTCLGKASRTSSLWNLSLLGGSPRMLMENAGAGAVSPDGSRIAYFPGPNFGSELWLMDPDGTNPRKIATAQKPGGQIWPVVWSPGGQRIAYIEGHGLAAAPAPAEGSFSLLTRDANGGDLQVVLNYDTRLKQALSWVADGRILFAYSEDSTNERNDQGVYAIQVDERTGKATGQPQAIAHGEGRVGGLSVTSDGKRLVLWRRNSQPQAFIVEFEAGSRRLKTPRRLTLDANGNLGEAWTPDSKAVLFVSNRNGTWKLFKQAIDERTAEVVVEGRSLFLPRLNPDGSQVLYLSYPQPANSPVPVSIMRKPLAGGPPQPVLQERGIGNFQCARTPSQLCIFSKLVGTNQIFVSFDIEHGAGRELTRTPGGPTNWTLSPNGMELAIFLDKHRIRFFSLDIGVARDVSVDDWPVESGDWSADGKRIFIQSVTSRGTPVILDVNKAGKAEVVLEGDANTSFDWMIQSPDGRYGILGTVVPGDNNVWMVENF